MYAVKAKAPVAGMVRERTPGNAAELGPVCA
jgi:hypothetical protein